MRSSAESPEGNASLAMSHFLLGLIKADGVVTAGEESKVKVLVKKFGYGMPGEPDDVMHDVFFMNENARYSDWKAGDHLDQGFQHFDKFVEAGLAERDHMETIVEMLEILSEVDGISDAEIFYMKRLREQLMKRYDFQPEEL